MKLVLDKISMRAGMVKSSDRGEEKRMWRSLKSVATTILQKNVTVMDAKGLNYNIRLRDSHILMRADARSKNMACSRN